MSVIKYDFEIKYEIYILAVPFIVYSVNCIYLKKKI